MYTWQEQYLQNLREVADICPLFGPDKLDFDAWYAIYQASQVRLKSLKEQNTALLTAHLFPLLDTLHSATEEELIALDAFADQLLDWKTNLDCGAYIAIHDALLSLRRFQKNQDLIIRELYKLGMGVYFLNQSLLGIEGPEADSMLFANEMLFTEAAAYFRYFASIQNDETRGYIIRSMANISISSNNYHRRINASMRTIATATNPEVRALAPSLPWDTYLSRAHQQLSTFRSRLSEKEVSPTQVAAIMDSCYEMFKPQKDTAAPNIRWLWPYYDMEYHCGYVGLDVTVERLEHLIRETPAASYDVAGLYGNVQLPIFLGRMLRDHPKLREDVDHRRFLDWAYRKMMTTLMTIPPALCVNTFQHVIAALVTDFYELEDCISYREVTTRLMQRFAGRLYLRSLLAGDLLACICGYVLNNNSELLDRLPIYDPTKTPTENSEMLLLYARDCALYHDFGLFKMRLERTQLSRTLFENEDKILRLHTRSGYEDLTARESTRMFADVARGHHTPYTQDSADSSGYERMQSPWRQMTDWMAIVSDLLDSKETDVCRWVHSVRGTAQKKYSPMAMACMEEPALQAALTAILCSDDRERCLQAYIYYYSTSAQ